MHVFYPFLHFLGQKKCALFLKKGSNFFGASSPCSKKFEPFFKKRAGFFWAQLKKIRAFGTAKGRLFAFAKSYVGQKIESSLRDDSIFFPPYRWLLTYPHLSPFPPFYEEWGSIYVWVGILSFFGGAGGTPQKKAILLRKMADFYPFGVKIWLRQVGALVARLWWGGGAERPEVA